MAAEPAGTTIRRARRDDAPDLARLIVTASEGIALDLWRSMAEPGRAPIDVGIERARRDDGGFSHRHAEVAEVAGGVGGMVLAYAQPANLEPPDEGQPLILPLARLEAEAPGSWYVNALAVDPAHRGRGLGRALMARTLVRARAAGCGTASLIVFAANNPALALYRDLGFRVAARRPPLPGRRFGALGELLLLTLPVAGVDAGQAA